MVRRSDLKSDVDTENHNSGESYKDHYYVDPYRKKVVSAKNSPHKEKRCKLEFGADTHGRGLLKTTLHFKAGFDKIGQDGTRIDYVSRPRKPNAFDEDEYLSGSSDQEDSTQSRYDQHEEDSVQSRYDQHEKSDHVYPKKSRRPSQSRAPSVARSNRKDLSNSSTFKVIENIAYNYRPERLRGNQRSARR